EIMTSGWGGETGAGGVVLWRGRADRRGATRYDPQLRPPHQPAAPARRSLTNCGLPAPRQGLAGAASRGSGGRPQQNPGGSAAPENFVRPDAAGGPWHHLTPPTDSPRRRPGSIPEPL